MELPEVGRHGITGSMKTWSYQKYGDMELPDVWKYGITRIMKTWNYLKYEDMEIENLTKILPEVDFLFHDLFLR